MDIFGYFGIDLLMIPFWIYLYSRSTSSVRYTMIRHGIYGGLIAIGTEHIFIKDYWVPPPISGTPGFYLVEDFLYGFFIIGITTTLYDWLFKVHKVERYPKQRFASYFFVVLILGAFVVFSKYYGYNSTFVISLALFIAAVIMLIMRRDLLPKAVISSLLVLLIFFLIHVILFWILLPDWWYNYWLLADKPYAFYILNTPWTEYMWYVAFGFFMSIISDFSHGRANIKMK